MMARNYLNCAQVAAEPQLLAGWFVFVDTREPVESLEDLAGELVNLVTESGGHTLWLNPETDGRRVGARAFNAPLTFNGRRLSYHRSVEGAIFPTRS